MLAVFVVLLAVDQATKWLVVERLEDGGQKKVVGDLLVLHLTRNAGAAFSTGTGYTVLFTCLAVAAAGVVLWVSRRLASTWWAVGLGLLLAGICGNLSDRLFRAPGVLRGQVVDFLQLPHWPIFNVADTCINLAAALILVQAFRGIRLDGTFVDRRTEGTAAP
jgi:signal peptidase II